MIGVATVTVCVGVVSEWAYNETTVSLQSTCQIVSCSV